jgi:hypothetical protein
MERAAKGTLARLGHGELGGRAIPVRQHLANCLLETRPNHHNFQQLAKRAAFDNQLHRHRNLCTAAGRFDADGRVEPLEGGIGLDD